MKYTPNEETRMHQMLLSPHFTLGEFLKSGTAIRHSIDNTPPDIIFILRMMMLCEVVLEPLRQRFGRIIITSGYRCHLLNMAVGGAFGSQHEMGEAADIYIPNEDTMRRYVEFIHENCDFDQMIQEPRGQPTAHRWLHVSYTLRRKNRRQILA